MRRTLQQALTKLLVVLYILAVTPFAAFAQAIDVDGPSVILDESSGDVSNTTQTFSLLATDEGGMESVVLFHRLSGERVYETTLMQRDSSTADRFTAEVVIEVTSETTLEYYIQAEDAVGNIVLKGFSFDPLTRPVAPPGVSDVESGQISQASSPTPATQVKSKKLLYTVLGVLALGALAGLAGGSSGGDAVAGGPGAGDCTQCTVTIAFPVPQ